MSNCADQMGFGVVAYAIVGAAAAQSTVPVGVALHGSAVAVVAGTHWLEVQFRAKASASVIFPSDELDGTYTQVPSSNLSTALAEPNSTYSGRTRLRGGE